jgi:F0F1-type ATP synthase membrane subunit c/vacuolar-type H+-ATPase subunit K
MTTTIDKANRSVAEDPDRPRVSIYTRLFLTVSRLFPDADTSTSPTRRKLWLGLLAVVAGTVVSLLRTTGTGPLQSVYEEDAHDILTVAFDTSGWDAVLMPVQGYFVIGPRLLGELAKFFPISWAAAVLSISSALICALLTVQVYIASGSHIRSRLGRFAVAMPILLAPVAENMYSEIYNRPVCLHFFAMYAVFWILVWTPATRKGRIGALITVGLTAFSSALIVGFLPLAALRLYMRRDRFSIAMLGLVVAGSALQIAAGPTSLGLIPRNTSTRMDPAWALWEYARWAVPQSLFGTKSGYFDTVSLQAFVPTTGLLVVAAINYRSDDTRRHFAPQWTDQISQATRWCAENPAKSDVVVRGAPKQFWSHVHHPVPRGPRHDRAQLAGSARLTRRCDDSDRAHRRESAFYLR